MPEHIIGEVVRIRVYGRKRYAPGRSRSGSDIRPDFLDSSVPVGSGYALGYQFHDVPGDRDGTGEDIEEALVFRAGKNLVSVDSVPVLYCGSFRSNGYDVSIRVLNYYRPIFRNSVGHGSPGRYDRGTSAVRVVRALSVISVGISSPAFPFGSDERHFTRIRRSGTGYLIVVFRRISHTETDWRNREFPERKEKFRLPVRKRYFRESSGSVYRKPFFACVVEIVRPRFDARRIRDVRKFVHVRRIVFAVPYGLNLKDLRFVVVSYQRRTRSYGDRRRLPRIGTNYAFRVEIVQFDIIDRYSVGRFTDSIYDIPAVVPEPSRTPVRAFPGVGRLGKRSLPVHKPRIYPRRGSNFRIPIRDAGHPGFCEAGSRSRRRYRLPAGFARRR